MKGLYFLPTIGALAAGSTLPKRQVPASPSGETTISSSNSAEIRYKEPGKAGVCETAPGVNLSFWFFEARENTATALSTPWLNGGPGSDSLSGLFQELGSCNVTEDLQTQVNPYAWNNSTNLLFFSPPIGVDFFYDEEYPGYYNDRTGRTIYNASNPNGRFSWGDPYRYDTTYLSAVAMWEIMQGFLTNLPTLDSIVKNKMFNLWTKSYGGHYGPAFYEHFTEQNAKISNSCCEGVPSRMDTLGIGNGIISELIQAPYYPEFTQHNTYGIQLVNESIYESMKRSYYIPGGCQDQIHECFGAGVSTAQGKQTCQQATSYCRSFVEQSYYYSGGRGVYDIRHP